MPRRPFRRVEAVLPGLPGLPVGERRDVRREVELRSIRLAAQSHAAGPEGVEATADPAYQGRVAAHDAVNPVSGTGVSDAGPYDRAVGTIGADPVVPLWIDDTGAGRAALGRQGRPRSTRAIALEHFTRRPRRAHDPRFGQLGQGVGQISRVGRLVAVGRTL
jgi:hypothetical protein